MSDEMNRPLVFGVDKMPPPPKAERKRSAPVNYTVRAEARLGAGRHPLDRPLAKNGETCGTCRFLYAHTRARTYYKCSVDPKAMTHGPATDVRKKWPACVRWQPQEMAS